MRLGFAIRRSALVLSACWLLSVQIALAGPYETLSGSAICDDKPTNFILAMDRLGPLDPEEFQDPCRSGSGPCNDMYRLQFELARYAAGKAVILTSNQSLGFTQTNYDLTGRVFEMPRTYWDRSDATRYEYIFEATPQMGEESGQSVLNIKAVRYTGLYSDDVQLHLEISAQSCAEVEFVHKRYPPPKLGQNDMEREGDGLEEP